MTKVLNTLVKDETCWSATTLSSHLSQSVQVQGNVQPWQRRLQPRDRGLLLADPRQVAEKQLLQFPAWSHKQRASPTVWVTESAVEAD